MYFEYKNISIPRDTLNNEIKTLGLNGWELIQIYPLELASEGFYYDFRAVLKREII